MTTTVLKTVILQTIQSAVLAVFTTMTNLDSDVKTVLLAETYVLHHTTSDNQSLFLSSGNLTSCLTIPI